MADEKKTSFSAVRISLGLQYNLVKNTLAISMKLFSPFNKFSSQFSAFENGETQRGCFHTDIAMMITGSDQSGCHNIPETIGQGKICLCDSQLCNSSQNLFSQKNLFLSTVSSLIVSLLFSFYFFF